MSCCAVEDSACLNTGPSSQLLTFKAAASNEGMLAGVKVRNFSFKIDEPEALGGTDNGANPVEYVLAALVA